MMNRYIIFSLFLIFVSCKPSRSAKEQEVNLAQNTQELKLPVIPAATNVTTDRLVYLSNYYWRMMNVVDKNGNLNKEMAEQNLVDYLGLLVSLPADQGAKGIHLLMDKAIAHPAVFRHFIGLFEKYLYDSTSPLRNEELYIAAMEYVVNSPKINAFNKSRPQYQLEMLYKNRLGNKAEDFVYINVNGEKSNLHRLKSRFTLVFFYDPDCEYCQAAIKQLKNSKLLKDMQHDKELQVLAVYTESNSKQWLDYAPLMPMEWLNVSDQQQISLHKKYDLKALPSLYLLDKEKKVLLKDVNADTVEDYIYDKVIRTDI